MASLQKTRKTSVDRTAPSSHHALTSRAVNTPYMYTMYTVHGPQWGRGAETPNMVALLDTDQSRPGQPGPGAWSAPACLFSARVVLGGACPGGA